LRLYVKWEEKVDLSGEKKLKVNKNYYLKNININNTPSHTRRLQGCTLFKLTSGLLITLVLGINGLAFIDNGWPRLIAEKAT